MLGGRPRGQPWALRAAARRAFRAFSGVQLPPAAARCFEGLSALFSFAALGKLLVSSSLLSARCFVRGVGHIKDTENRI